MLPPGFTSRVIARAGQVVTGTNYAWHQWPDGGATFARPDSGWIYVSNSEVDERRRWCRCDPIRARRLDRRRVLDLLGHVAQLRRRHHPVAHVADLRGGGRRAGVGVRSRGFRARGRAAGDGRRSRTKRLRPIPRRARCSSPRTTPTGASTASRPRSGGSSTRARSKSHGRADNGAVTWIPADASGATNYAGGEGIAYYDGSVVFTTKSDGRIRAYDTRTAQMRVLYEPGQDPEIVGPDNITFASNGDLYVCEDTPADQDLLLFGADGTRTQVLRLDASHAGSELAGVAFDPSGTRMYISSQRGGGGDGVTYEISGPFRTLAVAATTTTDAPSSTAPTTSGVAHGRPDDTGGAKHDGTSVLPVAGAVGGAAVLALGGLAWLRTRRGTTPE